MQSMLGDVHDCDVWMDFISKFIIEEKERTIDYFGDSEPFRLIEEGLNYLSRERKKCRDKTFEQLVTYWNKAKGNRVWENMLSLVKACAE
jgi:hypothetical protein